jgi:hypothetical protein
MKESYQTPLGKVFDSPKEMFQVRYNGQTNDAYICLPIQRANPSPALAKGALMYFDGTNTVLCPAQVAAARQFQIVVMDFAIPAVTTAQGVVSGYAWFKIRGTMSYPLAVGTFAVGCLIASDATNGIKVAIPASETVIEGAQVIGVAANDIRVRFDFPVATRIS